MITLIRMIEMENKIYELDEESKMKWYKIIFGLKKQFDKKPDMNGLLFLIGMRELGQNRTFSKDEKMDLMHIATCKLLSYEGYYAFSHTDEDGWPHYNLVNALPYADLIKQENFLKKLVVRYFEEEGILDTL